MSNKIGYQNYDNDKYGNSKYSNYSSYGSISPPIIDTFTTSSSRITGITRIDQFRKQDEIIDILGNIVTDVKQIASNMNNEIKNQNDTIIDLTNHVDNTDNDINHTTGRVTILKKDSCGCWCLAIAFIVFFAALVISVIVLTIKINNKSSS
jgi:hypothetical protein